MREEVVTNVWKMYENGVSYQSSIGLRKEIHRNIDFFEGRQWPPATEITKTLPRPVVNLVKFISRNKRSLLCSVPVKLVYKSDIDGAETEKFTKFADYILKEMKMAELDNKAINDGVIKGSYFYHYYWDAEEEAVRAEVIDARNIFFANPKETEEQKQKWIIISTREEVSSVREKADKDIDENLIVADDEKTDDDLEQEGSELCTVLTRYFKQKGEVYCEKSIKGTVVNKAFPIAPDIELAKKKLGFDDAPNNNLPDNALKSDTKAKYKAKLYPIVAGSYEEREKCIYGISEVSDIIPNQRSINFDLAMQLLANENLAWGKYLVSKDALRQQTITNEPGQVIIDYSAAGNGIRKMEAHAISAAPLNTINTLADFTRVVTGSTEVMTGEALGANMSGAAIAQLQSQANRPIEEQRERFWKVKERQGKVLEQFFKLYYDNKRFTYTKPIKDMETGEEQDQTIDDTFNGAEFQDKEFSVIVEATSGTRSSAAGDVNFLDTLFAKGYIDVVSYVKAYPSDILTDKSKIQKIVEESQGNQVMMLQEQLKKQQEQLVSASQLLEKQNAVINSVTTITRDNNNLRAEYAKLYAEALPKITQANTMSQKYGEVEEDARYFAQIIAQKAGIMENNAPDSAKIG